MKVPCIVFLLLLSAPSYSNDLFEQIIQTDHLTDTFIVADKSLGILTIVNPTTHYRLSTPALYGKLIADKIDLQFYDMAESSPPYITPAGIYSLKKMYSDTMQKNILVFYEGENTMMSVHSVYTGNILQQRLLRLQNPDPMVHRITNGCINVDLSFFNEHLFVLKENTLLYILPEAITMKKEWKQKYNLN